MVGDPVDGNLYCELAVGVHERHRSRLGTLVGALVRASEASQVAAYVFFVLPIVGAMSVLFLGENLNSSLLVGTALVVLGI